MIRTGHVARTTAETDIDLTLCLEGSGKTSVATGFGLLDHMLTLTAFWAGFDLSLTCKGDTHIDAHHSAEDIALCLGQAFALAVGDRKGIARVGFARVPMDEALAEVTLDISGRPWLEWRGDELLPPVLAGEERDVWREFYKSFAAAARMNVHVAFLYGRNGHHLLESAAKGLGLALAQAASLTGNVVRRESRLMSRLTRRFFCLAVLAVSISLLAACQKTTPSTPDLPDLKVGVVGVEQPKGTTDLLAGFIPEDRVLASDQAVATFNEELMKLLKTTTHRSYVFIPKAGGADPRERNGALAHWAKIGKDMGVDLLIVPQILDWSERAGSSAGVTTSAAVNMDFYLIDVREPGGALVSRSHFKEKQVGLSDNLMNFDTFLKRGAKWLTAQELAMEGMQKMIKEFGL